VIRCNRCDALHEVTACGDGGAAAGRAAAPSSGSRCEGSDPLGIESLHLAGIGPDGGDTAHFDPGEAAGRTAVFEVNRGELPEWDEAVWRDLVGPGGANGESFSHSTGAAVEEPRDDGGSHAELEEARSELDRLRSELDSLSSEASRAERLAAECEVFKAQVDEKSRRQEELRIELEEARSELERLAAEAAALRDRAASADHLEDDLRGAREEVARLQAECGEARAAAATATREFADLLDHSATLQDGVYRALAEIETDPSETLIPPQETERLRARLVELEGQVAEAVAARRSVEDDLNRTLRAREWELEAVREELRKLRARMKELPALEAEEARLRTPLASGRVADDEITAEVAQRLGSVPGPRGRGAARRISPDRRPAGVVPPAIEPAARRKAPANGPGGSESGSSLPASRDVDAARVDFALELLDIREFLPQQVDPGESRPAQPISETAAPAIEPGLAAGPVADREITRRPESAADPPVDLDALKAEALRLRARVLERISVGRKNEAEILARRMVELTRIIAGELSPDHSIWMKVVGQLQAEQGDWAAARASFDRKNAAFRHRFGERDPRYLSCVADSAEALLGSGDLEGARVLYEQAEGLCRQALDAAHPFAITVRRKLDQLREQGHNAWTFRAST
jgi:hypothetical protein